MAYSTLKPEGKSARAFGNEMRTSWKNAINVARAIRGLEARKAEAYLEDVIALKRPVPFITRNRKVAAKRGIGRGRFPQGSARSVLYVLRNAINNAEYAGYDPDEMFIVHASAYKGRTIHGSMPRAHGRATDKNEDTTNVEIILLEREVKEEKAPKKAAPAKAAAKPAKAESAKPAAKDESAKAAPKAPTESKQTEAKPAAKKPAAPEAKKEAKS